MRRGEVERSPSDPAAVCVLLCHEFTAFLLFGLFFWIRTGPIRPYLERGLMAGLKPPLLPRPPDSPLSPTSFKHATLRSPLSKIQLLCNKVRKNKPGACQICADAAQLLAPGWGWGCVWTGGGWGGGRDASSMSCVFVAVLFCFAYK